MSDTGDTQAQDTDIEEPEAFATLVRHPKLTDEEAGWLVRAHDEAVAAAARREVVEACCAAECLNCAKGTGVRLGERADSPIAGDLTWVHSRRERGLTWQCYAWRIRHLAAERGWLAGGERAAIRSPDQSTDTSSERVDAMGLAIGVWTACPGCGRKYLSPLQTWQRRKPKPHERCVHCLRATVERLAVELVPPPDDID